MGFSTEREAVRGSYEPPVRGGGLLDRRYDAPQGSERRYESSGRYDPVRPGEYERRSDEGSYRRDDRRGGAPSGQYTSQGQYTRDRSPPPRRDEYESNDGRGRGGRGGGGSRGGGVDGGRDGSRGGYVPQGAPPSSQGRGAPQGRGRWQPQQL